MVGSEGINFLKFLRVTMITVTAFNCSSNHQVLSENANISECGRSRPLDPWSFKGCSQVAGALNTG